MAIRNWAFTIQSGTATNGQLPNRGSLVLASTAGYQQNSFSGQASLVGQSGPDVATTPVSLTTAGGIETLVLPVIRLPAVGTPGQIYIEGTIVATRTVPNVDAGLGWCGLDGAGPGGVAPQDGNVEPQLRSSPSFGWPVGRSMMKQLPASLTGTPEAREKRLRAACMFPQFTSQPSPPRLPRLSGDTHIPRDSARGQWGLCPAARILSRCLAPHDVACL